MDFSTIYRWPASRCFAGLERARRRWVVRRGETDYRRWRDPRSYNDGWSSRLDAAMPWIRDARWVADLGCGAQELRTRLPDGAVYLPMDLTQWTPDTLPCDINAKHVPNDYLVLCDLCVTMGVLEYLYDPPWLLSYLAEYAEAIVLSYNAVDISTADRLANGWVNAFTAADVVAMIERAGYRVVNRTNYLDQTMIGAVNAAFDETRRRWRHSARQAYLEARGQTATCNKVGEPA